VLRLQKKDSSKTSMWVIASLPQCDCNLVAVCLRLKKQLQKHVKKSAIAKNQFKQKLHVMTLLDCD
jgi:hypothetical protein